MGPRLFRRGNILVFTFTVWCNALQWGHVFSDVETALHGEDRMAVMRLQWGHVFSDVETEDPRAWVSLWVPLQWGHVFSDVETFTK